MAAWTSAGKPAKCLPQMTVAELARRLSSDPDSIAVLDVRSPDEWTSEHIAGAIHCYAGEIAQGAEPELPADRDIAVICGSGYRSSFAASLLQARDYARLINVDGGMEAWQDTGLPVTK
jgi:hydroxyacylglutathione hydrolase